MKNLFDIAIGRREEFQKKLIKPRPLGGLEVNCITDGSKTDDGTGAAYYMIGNDDEWRIFKRQRVHTSRSINNGISSRGNSYSQGGAGNNRCEHHR